MKKTLLTFFVAILTLSASAQLSGGLKGGLNLANFAGDVEDNSMRIGFHVGGFLTFNVSDALSIQPEVLYNSVGSKFESGNFDFEYVLDYISIPVMVLYNVNENFNIQVGPQLGLLTSAKGKSDGASVDLKDFFKGTDFGVNLGVGLNFGKISASARYSLGLANIVEEEGEGDEKITNSVIQASIGYRLFGGN
jgi:hypothetical protein